MRETTLQIPKSVKKEGGGGPPNAEAGIPLQTMEQTTVKQAALLQSMEVHRGAVIHLQPWEDPTVEQVDAQRSLLPYGTPALEQAPARTCGPVERGVHAKVGFLAGFVTPWGTHAGAACS